MTKFKIKISKKNINRFKDYINSRYYLDSIELTDHWHRRENNNRQRFQIKNDHILCDTSLDTGLSDKYNNSFYNRYTLPIYKF